MEGGTNVWRMSRWRRRLGFLREIEREDEQCLFYFRRKGNKNSCCQLVIATAGSICHVTFSLCLHPYPSCTLLPFPPCSFPPHSLTMLVARAQLLPPAPGQRPGCHPRLMLECEFSMIPMDDISHHGTNQRRPQ
jgi:hypothetical protein